MTVMRAKMQVLSVTRYSGGDEIRMAPVCGNAPHGPNGESEDNTFALFTPWGELRLAITNPDLLGRFKPGQKFYLDFTEATN